MLYRDVPLAMKYRESTEKESFSFLLTPCRELRAESVGKLVGARPINYPSQSVREDECNCENRKFMAEKESFSSSIHTFTCSLNIHHHAINLAYK